MQASVRSEALSQPPSPPTLTYRQYRSLPYSDVPGPTSRPTRCRHPAIGRPPRNGSGGVGGGVPIRLRRAAVMRHQRERQNGWHRTPLYPFARHAPGGLWHRRSGDMSAHRECWPGRFSVRSPLAQLVPVGGAISPLGPRDPRAAALPAMLPARSRGAPVAAGIARARVRFSVLSRLFSTTACSRIGVAHRAWMAGSVLRAGRSVCCVFGGGSAGQGWSPHTGRPLTSRARQR